MSTGDEDMVDGSPRRQCTDCADVRKLRRDLKQKEQELKAAHDRCYQEQQQVYTLQGELHDCQAQLHQLRVQLVRRSTSIALDGWFSILLDANRRPQSRREDIGQRWRSYYVILRNGQLFISGGQNGGAVLTVFDIDGQMKVSAAQSTDPEIIMTGKKHNTVLKISSDKDMAVISPNKDSNHNSLRPNQVVLLDAPSSEDRDRWVKVLSEEIAYNSVRCPAQQEETSFKRQPDFDGNELDEIDGAVAGRPERGQYDLNDVDKLERHLLTQFCVESELDPKVHTTSAIGVVPMLVGLVVSVLCAYYLIQ